MDAASIFCIGLGILIIAGRSPLIIAPRPTLRWFQRVAFATNARARAFGVMIAALAAGLIRIDFGSGVIPDLLYGWGWLMAAAALWALLATGSFRGFYDGVMDFFEHSVDEGLLRGMGVLGLLFGLWLIYLGIEVL
jgi:hypothetical protein